MNSESYADWKKVYRKYEVSGKSKEEYCRESGIEVSWFERQCRRSAAYEKKLAAKNKPELPDKSPDNLKDLFIELVPTQTQVPSSPSETSPLKLCFRGVSFELPEDFGGTGFKRALKIIREVL